MQKAAQIEDNPDKSLGERIRRPFLDLHHKYFGHPVLRALHLRLLRNAALFAGSIVVFRQYGELLLAE
ncbi:Uncharacterized protein PBTT_00906 [Plasmodiophora brassicae]